MRTPLTPRPPRVAAAPGGFGVRVPNVARMYNCLIGGKDNYARDRLAVNELLSIVPEAADVARTNRAFVTRVVLELARSGIDQFLDIGCGIPGANGAVHSVARSVLPEARVVYVDYDPLVVVHGRALLARPGVAMLPADIRETDRILSDPVTTAVLDLTRPIAVLMGSVLHYVVDDELPAIFRALHTMLPPGSAVAMSHLCDDDLSPGVFDAVVSLHNRASAALYPRSSVAIGAMLAGFTLLDPGVVEVSRWRPAPDDIRSRHVWYHLGGVGRVEAGP